MKYEDKRIKIYCLIKGRYIEEGECINCAENNSVTSLYCNYQQREIIMVTNIEKMNYDSCNRKIKKLKEAK